MILKISKFEKLSLNKEFEVRHLPEINIKPEDMEAILKVIPASLKYSIYYNDKAGTISCYSKKKSDLGIDSIEIKRKGNYLLGFKQFSNSNNSERVYSNILK